MSERDKMKKNQKCEVCNISVTPVGNSREVPMCDDCADDMSALIERRRNGDS